MIERIKKLMEKKGLSPSQFADEIGLKRSSLSHILSGRNNPSLDVVLKIKTRFNEINTDWLLFGLGSETVAEMRLPEKENIPRKEKDEARQQLLPFDTVLDRKPEKMEEKEYSKKENRQSTDKLSLKSTEVERIIVLYAENTFEFYKSR